MNQFDPILKQASTIPELQDWALPTALVAAGFGCSAEAIRSHKSRKNSELVEGKHWLKRLDTDNIKRIYWSKRGVIRLGFLIESPRAKAFRDAAEDFIVQAPLPPAAAAIVPAPSRELVTAGHSSLDLPSQPQPLVTQAIKPTPYAEPTCGNLQQTSEPRLHVHQHEHNYIQQGGGVEEFAKALTCCVLLFCLGAMFIVCLPFLTGAIQHDRQNARPISEAKNYVQ